MKFLFKEISPIFLWIFLIFISFGTKLSLGHTTPIAFSIPKGTPIFATADGRVSVLKSSFGGLGKYIYIDHGNGYKTVYGHLDKFNVKRGQKVKRGELIAYSGNSGRSTAPHLHYEVHKNGKKINPINFFFNDLTPNEYEEVIKLASVENQALGSTF